MSKETNQSTYSETDVRSSMKEFMLVERLARMVSCIQGMHPDYGFLAAELVHVLPFDVLGIVLLRHDRQAVRVTICMRDEPSAAYAELPKRWNVSYHQHPLTDSMFERMASKPELLVNVYPDGLDGLPAQCGDAMSSYHQLRTTCVVPLRTGEDIFGTLELGSCTLKTYEHVETQRLVTAVAQVLATAIERAQLGGNTQIQDRQRQALKDISTALASKADVAVVLAHITTGISNALNVSSLLVTFDAQAQRLQPMAQARFDSLQPSALFYEKETLDQTIIGSTLQQRQPLLSDDIETDERFPASRYLYTQHHMRSVLCYPLIADNAIYGALLLCSPESGGFTPLKVDIVALFANQAAIAIGEGMLMEAASQRSRFQRVIEQLEREVREPLSDAEEMRLFAQVRTEVRRTFGVSLSSLLKLIGSSLLTKDERANRMFVEGERKPRPQEASGQVHAVLMRADILSELSRLLVQQEQAVHGVRDAWLVSDPGGRCLYINPLAESLCSVRLIDIESDEVTVENIFASLFPRIRNVEEVRQYLHVCIDAPTPQTIRCIVAQEALSLRSAMERHEQGEMNMLVRHGVEDNTDTYYQLTRHSMYNQHGQLLAYALQVSDITTQVLDEANKTALLSSVSHYLRTPLTTIKAAVTGLLQDDIAWSEQMRREMLGDIDVETDHLTVLVNALVEVSRIEMGALILEKAWCNIEEIVYSALHKVQNILVDHPVRVQRAVISPLVYVDYVQIERVMTNLLENVARFSIGQTEIKVVIGVVEEQGQLAHLRVQVIYRGVAISEQERGRMFRSFERLPTSDNGLSLAICKGIIEAHQGRIWMESSADGSSRVLFRLPIYTLNSVQRQ